MSLLSILKSGPPFEPQNWGTGENNDINPLGLLNPRDELWYLRELGQALLTTSSRHVEISWDTHRVQSQALDTMLECLSRLDMTVKVRLNFFFHGWSHEVYEDTFSAMERIEEIHDCKSVALLHETRVKTCLLSDIHFASPRLKEGYKSWERTKGKFYKLDQSEYARLLPYKLIFRPDIREENLVYSWVGLKSTAARVNSFDWVKSSIGKVTHRAFGIESQSFADAVNIGIAKTLLTGNPLYQHIRTLVQLDDQEPFWMSYERLLTCDTLFDGRPAVTCDVYPTQYVDIPLAGSP
ncbi:MAG: hypothetical protein ISR45_09000 [Rhodospirillales bacterium]|nr:hypothetical protein [Rhodospirillales bacterium]